MSHLKTGATEQNLLDHGFEYHYNETDADTVELYGTCPECGTQMKYRGLRRFEQYIALMVCPECGREDEF